MGGNATTEIMLNEETCERERRYPEVDLIAKGAIIDRYTV